jgi:hypothetical protein
MDINEIAKKMTREEFIEQQSQQVYKPSCPHRFKLTDYFPKCSVKVFDCEECWENAVKGIKFKDDIEGDKMEDKTIKVRCIDNIRGSMYLTIGKEYEAREYDKERYSVINDREVESVYSKSKFEKITADILIVECINNSNQKRELTINKKYPVIKVKSKGYLIKNNIGNIEEYNLWRFKPAGPQKEVSTEENICYQKEYSGNKENKCIVKGSTCITRLKEPANIKEEYQRLKEENKKLKETLQDKNNYIQLKEALNQVFQDKASQPKYYEYTKCSLTSNIGETHSKTSSLLQSRRVKNLKEINIDNGYTITGYTGSGERIRNMGNYIDMNIAILSYKSGYYIIIGTPEIMTAY